MPKVSVIIPVYNVEKYIERCARSLFDQTLDDLEYIFVNDCSEDASMELLKKVIEGYPHRKHQVRIVDMPSNSGQAAVREKGIKLCTGDYVIHCDSDDWIEPDMYESLWNKAVESDYDIVKCGFIREYGDKSVPCNGNANLSFQGKQELISRLLISDNSDLSALWDKIVKRDIVQNDAIIFPEENMMEDIALLSQYFVLSDKFACINGLLYHYRIRPQSITNLDSAEACLTRLEQGHSNINVIVQSFDEFGLSSIYADELICLKYYCRSFILPVISNAEYRVIWKHTFPEIQRRIIPNKKMSIKLKAQFIFIYIGLYPILHKVFNYMRISYFYIVRDEVL